MSLKYTALLALTAVGVAFQDPPGHEYQAPGPNDEQCPCPYLNSLAHHNFIPRSGTQISKMEIVSAFDLVFNVDPAITGPIVDTALNGIGGGDTLDLASLDKHGLIEHDASLSRSDTALSNNTVFNATIWNSVAQHFTTPKISIAQFAQARNARIATARAENPNIDLGTAASRASLVEAALTLITFANGGTAGNADAAQVKILFEQERIPFIEGFTRPAQTMTQASIDEVTSKLTNTTTGGAKRSVIRRSLHLH